MRACLYRYKMSEGVCIHLRSSRLVTRVAAKEIIARAIYSLARECVCSPIPRNWMNLAFHRIKAAELSSSTCTYSFCCAKMKWSPGLSLARECVCSPIRRRKLGWSSRLFHCNHKAAELSRERSFATDEKNKSEAFRVKEGGGVVEEQKNK